MINALLGGVVAVMACLGYLCLVALGEWIDRRL